MAPFCWLAWLIGALCRFSRRSWMDTGIGLRPRCGGLALLVFLFLFLFLICFIIGLALVVLGFDLGAVDAWIDAQGGLLDALGSFLFRLASGLVVLLCLFMIGAAIFDRSNPERPGAGCAFLALAVGCFAWFGLIGN